jgi:ABC-type multidrug transport system fused ATPase/permease subunit
LLRAGNQLTADTAFLTITLLNLMRFPLVVIPSLVSGLAEVRVSVTRIIDFLNKDEIDPRQIDRPAAAPVATVPGYSASAVPIAVQVDDASFAWDKEPSLRDVSLRVPRGALCLVVGRVGSGKTSLLYSLVRALF